MWNQQGNNGFQNPMQALAEKIAGSSVSTNGTYLLPGNYLFQVVAAFFKNSRKGKQLFIVEGLLRQSDNPSRPVGTKASWICNLTDHDAAAGNVKGFIAASLGINPSEEERVNNEITPAVVSGAVAADNPLAGLILPVTCIQKTSQKGGEYTYHAWQPAVGKEPLPQGVVGQPPAAPAPAAPTGFGMPAPAGPPAPGFPAPGGMMAPPPPPPVEKPFPPPGWVAYEGYPGYYHNGKEVLAEADLRARG